VQPVLVAGFKQQARMHARTHAHTRTHAHMHTQLFYGPLGFCSGLPER